MWLPVTEAASILNIDRNLINHRVRSGKVRAKMDDGHRLVYLPDIKPTRVWKHRSPEETSLRWRYHGMINRCYDPENASYKSYGAKGVTVCERWLESFDNFYEDMGLPPFEGAQLDRKRNPGNYEPGNVQWSTVEYNQKNRKTT